MKTFVHRYYKFSIPFTRWKICYLYRPELFWPFRFSYGGVLMMY